MLGGTAMKTYAVRVEGSGINLAMEAGSRFAIGFFATRWIKASSAACAPDLAKAAILLEWSPTGEYGASNTGELPQLIVEDVCAIGLLRATFGRKPGGYSFYSSL